MMEEVGADRPLRVAVRLAGMLKACTVRMGKPKPKMDHGRVVKDADGQPVMEPPQPWAILLVDDGGDADQEALAFAKTFATMKDWLPGQVDQPVLVCGELSHRTDRDTKEETPEIQFIVREAYPLVDGISKFGTGLCLSARYEDPNLLARAAAIKNLATASPGKVKVSFELTWANGRKAEIDSGIGGVKPTPEFLAELEKIQKGDDYRLTVIKDVFLQPPEQKRWEKRF